MRATQNKDAGFIFPKSRRKWNSHPQQCGRNNSQIFKAAGIIPCCKLGDVIYVLLQRRIFNGKDPGTFTLGWYEDLGGSKSVGERKENANILETATREASEETNCAHGLDGGIPAVDYKTLTPAVMSKSKEFFKSRVGEPVLNPAIHYALYIANIEPENKLPDISYGSYELVDRFRRRLFWVELSTFENFMVKNMCHPRLNGMLPDIKRRIYSQFVDRVEDTRVLSTNSTNMNNENFDDTL
jgi:8-oxo-dGTP pyrophosphatase MutT (NUDIX family)